MLNFHDFDIQTVTNFFIAHPYGAGIFTYFIVFFEAMAVIGAIVPGAIIMPAIGFLIGSAIIPAGSIFMCAIAGAITGDCLSYWLGIYFQDRIHRIWPFTKWPNLLTYSKKFFQNHGGKSVFIGRFVGPARAMIPMVAGMLKMPLWRFLIAALPSAAIWAVGYMIPGILLGALSLELPPKVAAEFIAWIVLVALGLWVVIWGAKHFFKQISQIIDCGIMKIWKFCQKRTLLSWVTKILADPEEPDNHRQLTLLLAAFFVFFTFLLVLYQAVTAGVLVEFSNTIYSLLRGLRSPNLDNVFILFTMLGDPPVLVSSAGIVFLWLVWQRYWYVAIHWLAIIGLSGLAVSGIKLFMYLPRPGEIAYESHASSFPSAHVALCLAYYGFLAMVIARNVKASNGYWGYVVTAVLVSMVGFSRIYLGAHWFIDILASVLLSLSILFVVTVSYRRQHAFRFNGAKCALVTSIAFIIIWLGYSVVQFNSKTKEYALNWPYKVLMFDELTKAAQLNGEVPLYRLNRLGKPVEAFNLIYVGDLAAIGKQLSAKGWEPQPISLNFQQIIRSFAGVSVAGHLSIFPQLYHNKKIALLFTKKTDQDDIILMLRLWPSDISLQQIDSPVWIGSIEYNHSGSSIFSLNHYKHKQVFDGATEFLAKSLTKDFHVLKTIYSPQQQPTEMQKLHWDGKLLVIKYR